MNEKMTTLTIENNEKEDIVFPLLQTTAPEYNNCAMNLSEPLNAKRTCNEYDITDNDAHINVSVENSLNKSEFKSVTISFDRINYTIADQKGGYKMLSRWQTKIFPGWKRTPRKQILTNVSGVFTPGMNAILGIMFI